ncbi:MAG: DUF362 domain-containing protein [Gemmatimonadota bacterium]|nr:DUF362 domain-containing protein [Gemmatimonadota bacterium]MDH5549793.1 DUF362 domain-containing protein [Gemmatimonadota bacterium]
MSLRHAASIDRRGFLKGAAAGLVLIPHIELGALGSRLFAPKTAVALIRTSDRKDGVRRAMALLDPEGIAGRAVNLKPNFNTADPAPAGTHNDTLAQIVTELKERGARDVIVGESSFPPTKNVMEAKGVFDLASDMGFGIVNYDEIPDNEWLHFKPSGTHWPDGFHLPRHVVESEYNVSTCCLKTHGSGGVFTMSMKLSVGLTPKRIRRGMHRSPDMRRMIAELNQGYAPKLIIMDGVEAFTDGGPSRGQLAQANVMIAGTDRVAVDAVGLAVLKELGANEAIMGTPIFQQEQMARAVEVRLGIQGPNEIELVSDDEAGTAYAAKLEGILAQG